ncbi:DNA-binding response regulator, NarL/FixJ family, contains REC and HTH domains [Nonomuraea solani]|uniref:DNA-binding response regulator, NarL/FixJ family, contains REC and HTH domains n=1 Tax=Nonomuraea solani TaxID=1144553 RepID=A0A1H6EUP5_9ACTN|nr:response regulator transcription factor [Nonomuraea solani]SEH01518.1 DNA-binding response regulator, NarL/FixJ family, contains REC and HTH domains [Nonomuraea solani]
MTLRVVIADDEDLIRAGLRVILDAEPGLRVVGEAADGAAVLPVVRRERPDVVLMDVRMPALDGIQATERLMALDDPPKVLVVTTFENDDHVYDALRAGASGFLLKRAKPDDLVQAVRLVAAGESLLFPASIRTLAGRRPQAPSSRRAAGVDRLTGREGDVLRLMTRGLSNQEIAAELVVSAETVKTHVGNVLAKLGARDRTQAVIAAYESGFVSPLDP